MTTRDHRDDGAPHDHSVTTGGASPRPVACRSLQGIRDRVEDEPATGPWYAVRFSRTVFAIFEVFPDIAGREAHVAGGGGDIFRDLGRMHDLLVQPAHVAKVDVLLRKTVFT